MNSSAGRFHNILESKWNSRTRSLHRGKLKNIRSVLDTTRPTTFNHLAKKPKKDQMLEERFTEIERENRILLEKMTMTNKRTNKFISLAKSTKKSLNNYKRR